MSKLVNGTVVEFPVAVCPNYHCGIGSSETGQERHREVMVATNGNEATSHLVTKLLLFVSLQPHQHSSSAIEMIVLSKYMNDKPVMVILHINVSLCSEKYCFEGITVRAKN
jgi:hypothetical protein